MHPLLTHTNLLYRTHLTYAHASRATESDDEEEALHTNIMARMVTEKGKAKGKGGRAEYEQDKLNLDISD
jgi:hypothetical protein